MTRVLSGIVMAAVALAAILFLPPFGLRLLACAVAALAAHEYLRLVGGSEGQVGGVVIFTWLISSGSITVLGLVPIVVLVIAGANALYPRVTGQGAVLGAFSIVYISVPLGMLAALHAHSGWRATVLLIATVVVSDSLQFYSGRLFGRHALAPAISPKKTIEGAIGGVIAGTLFMVFAGPLVFPDHPWPWLAGLGFVMVLLGILGDLFESRLKRDASTKDSSSLIPGHGGVLDRIDALLFVTPVFAIALGVVK
jgi:phosphatidate cytidylyltransferase